LILRNGIDATKAELNPIHIPEMDQLVGSSLIIDNPEHLVKSFSNLGLVNIQFYAGYTLRNSQEWAIGRIEFLDDKSRKFSLKDVNLFEHLAKQLAYIFNTELNLKVAKSDLETIFSNASSSYDGDKTPRREDCNG